MAAEATNVPEALRWMGDAGGHLELLDQTRLPLKQKWLACQNVDLLIGAIKRLSVRGAPAIGIAGAYGVVLAAGEAARQRLSSAAAKAHLLARAEQLAEARPTAVNLRWAVERVLTAGGPEYSPETLLAEARAIHEEDRRLCLAIGTHGAAILPAGDVLTHCNTGALATGGIGTALGVITTAWRQGRRFRVFADETRPLFQGSRLTAWELVQEGIPVTVLADGAAAHLLSTGRIGACIVGADRITANGDVANKIGTYGLALLAAAHEVPFFVAAPSSTFDLTLATGAGIPIEQRGAAEVLEPLGVRVAPEGAEAFNPAFDVTPARLIRAIITEHGVIDPVTPAQVARLVRPR